MKNGICMNLNNFVRVSVGKGINLWLRDERLNRCLLPLRSLVYSPAVCSALRRLAVYITLAIDYWTVTSNTLIAYSVPTWADGYLPACTKSTQTTAYYAVRYAFETITRVSVAKFVRSRSMMHDAIAACFPRHSS